MKKRKDGRYQSSVTVVNPLTGEKKKVYVYGYSAAELERERARVKRNNGQVSISNVQFGDWVKEWLEIKKDDIAQSTYLDYQMRIKKHIMPFLSDIKLQSITPALIRKIIKSADGDRTKKYIYVLLHSIFEQAYIDDIIQKNPCLAIKMPHYKAREKQVITDEDFRLLLSFADSDQYRNIFILAMYTGLRRGEICALRWRDVDIKSSLIKVTSAIKRTADGIIDGAPKTENSCRTILISKNIVKMLNNQYKLQQKRYFRYGKAVSKNDYVFTSEIKFNAVMPPNAITHAFTRIKNHAGIRKHITFHSFRHTHTTMLVESHIPIKAVQMRLGHSTAAFTMQQYAHNTEKMQREIIDLLDRQAKII